MSLTEYLKTAQAELKKPPHLTVPNPIPLTARQEEGPHGF